MKELLKYIKNNPNNIDEQTIIKFVEKEISNISQLENINTFDQALFEKQTIQTKRMVENALYTDTNNFKLIQDQFNTTEIQKHVLNENPTLIQYIKNPGKDVLKILIYTDPNKIGDYQDLKDQELVDKLSLIAIQKDIHLLKYIKNKTLDILKEVAKRTPSNSKALKECYHTSDSINLELIKINPGIFQHIPNMSDTFILDALKLQPKIIYYIQNPLLEMVKIAISQNGLLIRYIEKPSKEIQNLAVSQNGLALQYIKTPCYEIQKIAINNEIRSIAYSYKLTFEQTKEILIDNPRAYLYIPEQTEKLANHFIYFNPSGKSIVRMLTSEKVLKDKRSAKETPRLNRISWNILLQRDPANIEQLTLSKELPYITNNNLNLLVIPMGKSTLAMNQIEQGWIPPVYVEKLILHTGNTIKQAYKLYIKHKI